MFNTLHRIFSYTYTIQYTVYSVQCTYSAKLNSFSTWGVCTIFKKRMQTETLHCTAHGVGRGECYSNLCRVVPEVTTKDTVLCGPLLPTGRVTLFVLEFPVIFFKSKITKNTCIKITPGDNMSRSFY